MIVGIDISQICFKGTGVGRYVEEMVRELVIKDKKNKYILFGSSLRNRSILQEFYLSLSETDRKNVTLKLFSFPPKFLEFVWNRLHILPIEWFIGPVDVFWSSDWTQPPLAHTRGITTIHDLTIYKYPESFNEEIVSVHKRKLQRSKKECSFFLCDSETTKKDAYDILQIPLNKLSVVYPGYRL